MLNNQWKRVNPSGSVVADKIAAAGKVFYREDRFVAAVFLDWKVHYARSHLVVDGNAAGRNKLFRVELEQYGVIGRVWIHSQNIVVAFSAELDV